MAQRSHVPKFGNWESEENVPYTVYFDKARKDRTGGKMINPNDPEENPEMFPDIASPAQAPPSRTRAEPEEPIGRGSVRPVRERGISKEDGDLRQFSESPARNDNTGRKNSGESTPNRRGGRPTRQSAGSEYSIEKSPLHPQHQAKIVGKGSASPTLEGKNSYDSSYGTPGRSRMKPANRGEETPDRSGAAVPKFGDWDPNNPQAAEGYTGIFNRVRDDRNNGFGNSPVRVVKEPSTTYAQRQKPNDNAKCCCFPFGGK